MPVTSTAKDSIRTTLDKAEPGKLADALAYIGLGDLLSVVIAGLTPTEAGVVPSSNIATLAASAKFVFQVNATAGTVTGIKKLIPYGRVPATGECTFDGTTHILFAAVDAVTACSITYSLTAATDKASCTLADMPVSNL